MTHYFKKFISSITNKNFGASIKNEPLSSSMRYYLFIMAIIGAIVLGVGLYKLENGITEFETKLATDFPNFELKNGRFSMDGKMPYILKESNSIIIFDTSGKTSASVLDDYKEGALITEYQAIYKKSTAETRQYNFGDMQVFNFNKSDLLRFINNYTIPFLILFFILGELCFMAWKLIGTMSFSAVAMILNPILKLKLDFGIYLKMSLYAIIIPSILNSCLGIFDIEIPYFFVVYYGITLYFLVRYIKTYNSDFSAVDVAEQSEDK